MIVNDLMSLVLFFGVLLAASVTVGNYMAKVFSEKKVFLTPLLRPVELFIYKICCINHDEEMHWKHYLRAVLGFSFLGFIALLILERAQQVLPLNPQGFAAVPWVLAMNTAVGFVTNTNWQAYAGENTLSYLTQAFGLGVQNFLSAATGMAVLVAFIRGLNRNKMLTIGNFWVDLVRSVLYVFLPLSLVLAIALVSLGVVQNVSPYVSATTIEGQTQILPMGPAASQIAIKQLGTNGGGFFGANSAHPFENPNALSNLLELLAILLIPQASVYMFGVLINNRKHALMLYAVMLAFLLGGFYVSLWSEYLPNASLKTLALEGKELRFGVTSSVLWATATTATSSGSVNAMHDSLSPLAGGVSTLFMCLGEVIFGGVGSGLYGMLLFVLLTVFLAGLMVGRSPEYLGKKLEVFDMQMVVLAIVLPSAVVLLGAGLSCVLPVALASLGNLGPHGLTEMLYAWGSTANNNGSAFAGLNANTDFFNWALSLAMVIGRFGVMIPVLGLAGNFAKKSTVPVSESTFATDSLTFACVLGFIVVTVGALTFFPSLTLGPVAEHLLMMLGRTF